MRQQMRYPAQWPTFAITGEIAEKPKTINPASIDRCLRKDKETLGLKWKSCTRPLDSLKSHIPARTFYTTEKRKKPGFWQIDTVHHCRQATFGQYLHTLAATDVASGWIDLRSLPSNAHTLAFEALSDIKPALPLPVLELHSDNGSEFISNATGIWRKNNGILFTRSRGQRKNDNCFAGQKNGAVVRRYVSYERLEGPQAQALLSAVYRPCRRRTCSASSCPPKSSPAKPGSAPGRSRPATHSPFQRLAEYAGLPQQAKDSFATQIALYNPVGLQHNVNTDILRLRRRLAQLKRVNTTGQL